MNSFIKWSLVLLLLCPVTGSPGIAAAALMPPETGILPADWRDMKLKELVNIPTKEISRLAGKKMTFREKYIFFTMKGKMKHELKRHPEMTFNEFMVPIKQKDKVAWILLGVIILGLIGVAILVSQLPH